MMNTLRKGEVFCQLVRTVSVQFLLCIICLPVLSAHGGNGSRLVPLTSTYTQATTDIVITGVVNEAKTNTPVPGVNITIKGTTRGATTDAQGKYRIVVNGPSDVLVFSFIGYFTKEEPVGNRTDINVTLADDQKQLDEIVVTALGIKREERALGYAVQKVGGTTLQTVKGTNVATSLTGRVAGLWVQNSTEFNEAPTLELRGETPLLVIDGVPYGNMNLGNIPQDNIESIEVLKGPTAAALYGSRGGSGAIIVTTKRGTGTKGLTVTVNSNNMVNAGFLMLPEVQHAYSAGLGGVYDPTDYVWGAKLDIGLKAPQWNPITKQIEEMELTSRGKNNFRDFLVPGIISNNNISVSQTGENGSIRASLTHIYNKGQYPNLKANTLNFNVSGEMKVGDKFSLSSQVGYNRKTAPQTWGAGYYNQGYMYQILMWTGTEYDLSQYKNNYWLEPNVQQNWHYKAWYDNPYMTAYEKLDGIEQNKVNTYFAATYSPFPGAKVIVRPGFDMYFNNETMRNPPNILSTRGWNANGLYSTDQRSGFSFNGDAIFTYNKAIGKFDVDALMGGTIYRWTDRKLYSSTRGGIVIPGFYSLYNSVERPDVSAFTDRKQVNSLFGKATFSYANSVFLDVTGRNDWSSTMPQIARSYFYPSVGGSVVLSEFLPMPKGLDFLKVRGSWTLSKKDLDVYATNQTYSLTTGDWDNLNSATYPTIIRGGVVNPETNRTWEIGTSAYLFGKRLKFDVAYFNKYNYNKQIKSDISPASGFAQTLINTGETYVRRGLEVTLDATVIKKGNFQWDATANYSFNHQYYKSLDPVYSSNDLWTKVGGRYDTYTDYTWLKDPSGNLIHQDNGLPLSSDYQYLYGYSDPKFIVGFANSIRWNNFQFGIRFDGRIGGILYNYTTNKMWDTGSHPDSDNQWRYDEVVNGKENFVGQGVKVVGGSVTYDNYGQVTSDTREYAPNDTKISYQSYAREYQDGNMGAANATFLKLRELSIGYTLPSSFASRIGARSASISLTSQNVLMWTKSFRFADPDKNKDSELTSPSVRYVGANLQLTF